MISDVELEIDDQKSEVSDDDLGGSLLEVEGDDDVFRSIRARW